MRDLKKKLGDDAPDNDEYVDAAIRFVDKIADVFTRVCSASELEEIVPKSAKRPEVVREYRSRGANAIANICS